jgi:hypothetical protein
VRDRLMGDANGKDTKGNNGFDFTQNHRLKTYLKTGASPDQNAAMGQAPIADLFPNATVLFADVSPHPVRCLFCVIRSSCCALLVGSQPPVYLISWVSSYIIFLFIILLDCGFHCLEFHS